jgi:hypothetical protein
MNSERFSSDVNVSSNKFSTIVILTKFEENLGYDLEQHFSNLKFISPLGVFFFFNSPSDLVAPDCVPRVYISYSHACDSGLLATL